MVQLQSSQPPIKARVNIKQIKVINFINNTEWLNNIFNAIEDAVKPKYNGNYHLSLQRKAQIAYRMMLVMQYRTNMRNKLVLKLSEKYISIYISEGILRPVESFILNVQGIYSQEALDYYLNKIDSILCDLANQNKIKY